LKQRLTTGGSTLFKMTWKEKVTPSRQSVSLLRASGLRISGSDSGSWPTPAVVQASMNVDPDTWNGSYYLKPDGRKQQTDLGLTAMQCLSSWPTTTRDHKDGSQCDNVPLNALLGRVAWLANWPTPQTQDMSGGGQAKRAMGDTRHGSNLNDFAMLASWGTPNCMDSLPIRSDEKLTRAKSVAGCSNIRDQVPSGMPATGSPAATASGGQLNPAHSRWLMGYPTEWDDCAPTVTPSSRKSRRK